MNGGGKPKRHRLGDLVSRIRSAPLYLRRKIDVRFTLSSICELGGLSGFVWGFHLISPFLGFIVGGICLILVGLAIDPPVSPPKDSEQ
jgi:hypothetical protein